MPTLFSLGQHTALEAVQSQLLEGEDALRLCTPSADQTELSPFST